MRDIQRTISNADAHKSPPWLLLQRDSLFYPSELARYTPQGSAIQLPALPLEVCGHAIRGRTRKAVIKIDGAKRTLEAMSKGLISFTVQDIEGTPKPSKASIRMKNIHPSAHTQAIMAGLIHLPRWKKVQKNHTWQKWLHLRDEQCMAVPVYAHTKSWERAHTQK